MTIFLIILLVLACVLLGFFILIQNPKGGGLGSIGGVSTSISNQFGAQHSTNILEKGTYVLIAFISVVSILSIYVSSPPSTEGSAIDNIIPSPSERAEPVSPTEMPLGLEEPATEEQQP